MNEWMNDWTNKQMNEWTNAWMNGWMNEKMNEWTNEWMNGRRFNDQCLDADSDYTHELPCCNEQLSVVVKVEASTKQFYRYGKIYEAKTRELQHCNSQSSSFLCPRNRPSLPKHRRIAFCVMDPKRRLSIYSDIVAVDSGWILSTVYWKKYHNNQNKNKMEIWDFYFELLIIAWLLKISLWQWNDGSNILALCTTILGKMNWNQVKKMPTPQKQSRMYHIKSNITCHHQWCLIHDSEPTTSTHNYVYDSELSYDS